MTPALTESATSATPAPASAALLPSPAALRFGVWQLEIAAWSGLGLVVRGLRGEVAAPADYVNDVLLTPQWREAFFALVDRVGLVVCKGVGGDDAHHRDVRGRSSRGRLSPGEYFHHDGCAGPVKPRVVEIRCPIQEVQRHTATAIAPFPAVVRALLQELPDALRNPELRAAAAAATQAPAGGADWDAVQGAINRALRRCLSAEDQRAFLRRVDMVVGAYREPWEMGESRFIANANSGATMQHRRAYLEVHSGGRANGKLVKRWPAEADDAIDADVCAM